jgi:DNA-binding NarL/FixJ family response regulator
VSQISVLLAEDHTIVRKGLRALLDEAEDIVVVAEAENGREAVSRTQELQPDVVIMDISMPLLNGLEATRQIKKAQPDTRVLILTVHDNEEYILQTLQAGATGYLVKHSAPAELVAAIEAAYRGESYLSPTISKTVISQAIQQNHGPQDADSVDLLTTREREILQLIAEGHSNHDISEILNISEKTVRSHRNNLTDKLDIHSTAELTLYALRKGIITLDE